MLAGLESKKIKDQEEILWIPKNTVSVMSSVVGSHTSLCIAFVETGLLDPPLLPEFMILHV